MPNYRSKRLKIKPQDGVWYDIPGYKGRYQLNAKGEIRSVLNPKNKHVMKQHYKDDRGQDKMHIRLTDDFGKTKDFYVSHLMITVFCGKKSYRYSVEHTDGDVRNNAIDNLEIVDLLEKYRSFGRKVAKINKQGQIIKIYDNARKAAQENFLSRDSIINRTRHTIKKEFLYDGTSFRYLDQVRQT